MGSWVSQNGSWLAIGSESGIVYIYQLEDGNWKPADSFAATDLPKSDARSMGAMRGGKGVVAIDVAERC